MKKYCGPFLTFVLFLSSCNLPASTLTVELTPTPALFPSPSATPTAIQPLPEADTPQPSTSQPQSYSPILFRQTQGNTSFLVLGGVGQDEWLSSASIMERFPNVMTYNVYSLTDSMGLISGSAEGDLTCDGYFVVPGETVGGSSLVGVAQGWDVTQRAVEEFPPESDVYQDAMAEWLVRNGISNPVVENLRILRVDIEGDGVDEVFLSASHFADESGHMTEAGDYSVVLMRKVVDDDVWTTEIVSGVYSSQEPELTFPFTYSLANFIDLNQDGILEAVIELNRWEGFGAVVFQIDGQEIDQVLNAVCTL